MNQTIILTQPEIAAKLKRIAFEIYEQNFGEENIFLIGVGERGGFLAAQLKEILSRIAPFSVSVFPSVVNRDYSEGIMPLILPSGSPDIKGEVVIVTDDVLYSGRTMLSIVAQLLTRKPKKIQTMTLIDRGHRQMPISPDYVGMELATTLQQHVCFEFNPNGESFVYLQ